LVRLLRVNGFASRQGEFTSLNVNVALNLEIGNCAVVIGDYNSSCPGGGSGVDSDIAREFQFRRLYAGAGRQDYVAGIVNISVVCL